MCKYQGPKGWCLACGLTSKESKEIDEALRSKHLAEDIETTTDRNEPRLIGCMGRVNNERCGGLFATI